MVCAFNSKVIQFLLRRKYQIKCSEISLHRVRHNIRKPNNLWEQENHRTLNMIDKMTKITYV
jgi:hypothetical protein